VRCGTQKNGKRRLNTTINGIGNKRVGVRSNTRTNLSIYYGGYVSVDVEGKGNKREMGVNGSECDALG